MDQTNLDAVADHFLRCVADRTNDRYRLRIEDFYGNALTSFVEKSGSEAKSICENVVEADRLGSPARGSSWESGNSIEDYRLRIVNEEVLRARLLSNQSPR